MYKVDEILREVEEFPMDSIEERWLFCVEVRSWC